MSDDEKGADEKLLTRAYVDLFSGTVQQVGDRLTRAAALALAPADLALWSLEQVRRFVSEDLPRRLRERRVKPESIVTPAPQILGGVLAGLQVAGPEEELREMYANLLASAMDASSASAVHPAFAEIVRQLTSDEARVFAAVVRSGPYIHRHERSDRDLTDEEITQQLTIAWESVAVDAQLEGGDPLSRVANALMNLERLGLTENGEVWERNDEGIRLLKGRAVSVREFGLRFADACLPRVSVQPRAGFGARDHA